MFGKYIKELRLKKGWSQQKLAEESKLSFSLIGKLEHDVNKEPTIQTMIKLADAFNISIDNLVGRDFPKKK